ncbi:MULTISPECIES: hypothetical protein [Marinobacter]|uniref:Uncharacterized protein n=1 Tax=Marinobacter nauticus (strain ATCC 700491 / DSM 11845 / VT8) TaxID=351348 RepID=A1U7L6_MARN8|nr:MULTISPECIES: hypothetical protein [Marinobacter]ABM20985.1 hypothetical protein Maqu_4132 [Marinobacter nauticus VT8]|tara:strand:+ start:765 stop:1412 length:648 start_codon:yes stop_codon:yes gene_type:complete
MPTTTNIHMLMKGESELVSVTSTLDDIEREQAKTPGLRAYLNVDPLVVAQFLDGRMPWQVIKSDDAWQQIAPAIKTFHDHISVYEEADTLSTYHSIPMDMPPVIARERGAIMEKHPQIADLPAAIEISEIIMAANNRRPKNADLFRPESREKTWADLYSIDQKHLRDLTKTMEHQLIGTSQITGLTMDLARQQVRELQFVRDAQNDDDVRDAPSL